MFEHSFSLFRVAFLLLQFPCLQVALSVLFIGLTIIAFVGFGFIASINIYKLLIRKRRKPFADFKDVELVSRDVNSDADKASPSAIGAQMPSLTSTRKSTRNLDKVQETDNPAFMPSVSDEPAPAVDVDPQLAAAKEKRLSRLQEMLARKSVSGRPSVG